MVRENLTNIIKVENPRHVIIKSKKNRRDRHDILNVREGFRPNSWSWLGGDAAEAASSRLQGCLGRELPLVNDFSRFSEWGLMMELLGQA